MSEKNLVSMENEDDWTLDEMEKMANEMRKEMEKLGGEKVTSFESSYEAPENFIRKCL